MSASQGVLFLLREQEKRTLLVSAWISPGRMNGRIVMEINNESRLQCLVRQTPFKPDDIETTAAYLDVCKRLEDAGVEFRVSLVAPLISQGESVGFLMLGAQKSGSDYDDYMISFLQTLTQQAAMAIRNSALLIELKEQERYKRELEIARSVQERLLPDTFPDISGLEFNAICQSAYEVGGDYYDYFSLDKHRIGIAIADVTGKGTSAAFYMAELKGMMTFLAQEIDSPKKVLCRLNTFLSEKVDKRIFVTMIYGILNTRTGEFTFVRAGHNALVVQRYDSDNNPDVYIPPGIGLGLTNDTIFYEKTEEQTVRINPNDILFFYTDGLSEAMNEQYQEYSEEKLYNFLKNWNSESIYELQTELMKEIKIFTGDAAQHDDITMVMAKLTRA
ncbi:MAG: GAF domain-containing SpoIIE family protein phosphatase [candidate division KSB1 bacterium]|nr:GAF domain-containing SpoIIE family protein phosphatase [candidate division KSB1 bacterium]